MQTLTTAKVITPVVHRENGRVEIEYKAEFDGNLIGFFPTQHQAECEINQYVLLLCERDLVDTPLALQAEQALLAANPTANNDPFNDGPSQEEQAASAARWTACEGGWEQYTPHPFDETKTVRLFQPRLFAAEPGGIDTEPADDKPELPNMGGAYTLTRAQLTKALDGAIEMFLEHQYQHGHGEMEARRLGIDEILQGLDADRELAACDPTERLRLQLARAVARYAAA